MRRIALAGFLLIGLGLSNPAAAGEPGWRWWPWKAAGPACPACPDDYCPKKLPPAPCPARPCGPDDYCPKALPAACPVNCFGRDDYCRKQLPAPWTCCYPPWFTCGPAACPKPPR